MSKLCTTVRATFFLLNFRVEWTENDDIKHYIVYKRKLEFVLQTNFTPKPRRSVV